jgi:putative cardiolipin synthase
MGLVIESADLARRLANAFDTVVPQRSWQVRLAQEGGGLEWIDRTTGQDIVHRTEPETTWWRRFRSRFMAIAPIEWLL